MDLKSHKKDWLMPCIHGDLRVNEKLLMFFGIRPIRREDVVRELSRRSQAKWQANRYHGEVDRALLSTGHHDAPVKEA